MVPADLVMTDDKGHRTAAADLVMTDDCLYGHASTVFYKTLLLPAVYAAFVPASVAGWGMRLSAVDRRILPFRRVSWWGEVRFQA